MNLIKKSKPFTFKEPKPPPESPRIYTHKCLACSRLITFNTNKLSTGLCTCGFTVLTENEHRNDFRILTTKKEVFE